MTGTTTRRRIVLVTGLSGAGKTSILRTLEDLGYQAIDNLPLVVIKKIVELESQSMAIGVDARTRNFTARVLMTLLDELRLNRSLQLELVFATAAPEALLRRFTQTRRRHPLAGSGRVIDGVTAEVALMDGLSEVADLVVDTSELSPPALRSMIEARYGSDPGTTSMTVALVSFAFPAGVPREVDLVFDARFLRNPYYVAELRPLTGLHPAIGAYVRDDPDYENFLNKISDLLSLLLPRFLQEGKRYLTIGVGCTGGRHRSVHIVDALSACLVRTGWRVNQSHRELMRDMLPNPSIPGGPLFPISRADPPPSLAAGMGSTREPDVIQ
jgi:UPF0042 nucleotide-binding protein